MAVSGNQPPAVIVSGTFTAFSTTIGTPSAAQNMNVSGSNLGANLVVTAPTDFEVSLSAGAGFAASVSLSPTNGTVATTPVYVRYNPAVSGSSSGNITVASTGATTQNIAVSGTAGNPSAVIEKSFTSSISIYPNPSNGIFTINSTSVLNALITVSDITGKLVATETINGLNKQIDLRNHQDGVYFVCISKNQNAIARYKILLNKE